jgi:Ca2+ transporting ATPase
VIIVQFGGEVFSTHPLNAQQWAACTGIGALSLLVRAVVRLLPPHPQSRGRGLPAVQQQQ